MHTIILEMSEGLAGAVKILLISTVLMMPIAAWFYFLLIKYRLSNIKSSVITSLLCFVTLLLANYTISQIAGAEPFESLIDPILINTSLLQASFSITLIVIITLIRHFNQGEKD